MRCPKCDREEVDLLGKSEVSGNTYGCPRCHIMFTIEIEPYEAVDESEVRAGWEEQAQKLREAYDQPSAIEIIKNHKISNGD